ncbi:hypothetical protein J1N35_036638, partial [Gossypium stocksii]
MMIGHNPYIPQTYHRQFAQGFKLNSGNYILGLHSLRDLTQHLTTRAGDGHAPPMSTFLKAPLSFKNIRDMSSSRK